jgi:hypothetical protein
MRTRTLIAGAIALMMLAGCTGAASVSGNPVDDPTEAPVATSEPTPTVEPASEVETPLPEEEPTEEPAEEEPGTSTVAVGETTTITADGEDYLDITVSKPKQRKKYDGEYLDDKPKKGNVFLEVYVTYKALQDGASYNQFDWNVFVDGVAIDDFTFVSNGPEPTLGSGDLPEGRQAKGWLVYEIPAKGEAILSYSGSFINDAPIFEVVVRKG